MKPDVSPKHPSLLHPNSRSRRKMQGVANVSFLAMFLMYLLAALFGYLTFNGELGRESLGCATGSTLTGHCCVHLKARLRKPVKTGTPVQLRLVCAPVCHIVRRNTRKGSQRIKRVMQEKKRS